MSIRVLPSFLNEKHKQEKYKEDCLYYQTIQSIKEEYRDILIPPYFNVPEKRIKTPIAFKLDRAETVEDYAKVMFGKE